MPMAPPRPCRTCGRARCTEHTQATGWSKPRKNPTVRIRGRKLQALRRALFEQEPYCRTCREQGRFTLATIRDHIIPLQEGGPDDETNAQPLCQSCSDIKTQEESARGVRRSWD